MYRIIALGFYSILLIFITNCGVDSDRPSESTVFNVYQMVTERQMTIEEFRREYSIEYTGKNQILVSSPKLEECFPEELKVSVSPIQGSVYNIVIVSKVNVSDSTHFAFDKWPGHTSWWVTYITPGKNVCFPNIP